MMNYVLPFAILLTITSYGNIKASPILEDNSKNKKQQLDRTTMDSSQKKVGSIKAINRDSIIDCTPCSTAILAAIDQAKIMENSLVDQFFCTASETCHNYVEFSEFFNEICFKVLANNPVAFYAAFQKSKNKKMILENLENPVNDAVTLKDLINELNEQLPEGNEISKSIEKAILKY